MYYYLYGPLMAVIALQLLQIVGNMALDYIIVINCFNRITFSTHSKKL